MPDGTVQHPLRLLSGHLFIEIDGGLWLLDTGAPSSFGAPGKVALAGEQSDVASSYLGLDAATLTGFVGIECAGLVGADLLNRFDLLIDVPGGVVTLSTGELPHGGARLEMREFMGIPLVSARIGGTDHPMVLDTGAQISYFQDDSVASYPDAGAMTDFFPGFGEFQTDTHLVEFTVGGLPFTLRCGRLPGLLGVTLMMTGARGIIGNAVFTDRVVGYFPRRGALCL